MAKLPKAGRIGGGLATSAQAAAILHAKAMAMLGRMAMVLRLPFRAGTPRGRGFNLAVTCTEPLRRLFSIAGVELGFFLR